jgi:hypothetical protein
VAVGAFKVAEALQWPCVKPITWGWGRAGDPKTVDVGCQRASRCAMPSLEAIGPRESTGDHVRR